MVELTPNRKEKPMLTLIPEQERQIDYRFEFSVVGEGARSFAEQAVNSDMAEAFRPTAKEEEKWKPAESIAEDEAGGGAPGSDAEAAPAQSSSFGQKQGKGAPDNTKLILYCPVGESGKGLARIRFTVLENFSASLPTCKDRLAALNSAVIFLFWHVKPGDERDPVTNRTPTEDKIKDWMSRIAEINFTQAQCRPACAILGFEADEAQENVLNEWTKNQKSTVWTFYKPDDGEDTIIESLQELCEKLVERSTRGDRGSGAVITSERSEASSKKETSQAKSGCCAIS